MFLRTNPGGALIAAVLLAAACPAWAQFSASPPNGAATIEAMTGRVDILRDSAKWALNAGDWVKPGQMIVTGADGWATFRLADGSTFEVFPNSQVSFRANRGDWRDLLEVLLGNIKVHIQKLGGQPNNNKVRTPTALISVRGTIFDVRVDDEGDTTVVVVEEGLVDVEHMLLPGKKVQLGAGEAVSVYKTVPLAQNRIDKGSAAQAVLRGLAQGVYEALLGRQRGSGGSTGSPSAPAPVGGGTIGVGDQSAPAPPPPPPPPPPAAPPPTPQQ